MESINGLPAHPLFVHAPVVLMPLATIVTLVLAFRPTWRRRVGFALPAVAVVILALTQLAISSGNAFDEIVGTRVNTDDHESLALMTRNFIAVFVVASLLLALFDRWHAKGGSGAAGSGVLLLVAVTTISSLLATTWMIRTGDEGARLVWDGILPADDDDGDG